MPELNLELPIAQGCSGEKWPEVSENPLPLIEKSLNWLGDYQFTLTTPPLKLSIDWQSLLHKDAVLCLQETTWFHGIITAMQYFSNENSDFFLRIILSSPLLKLHTEIKNQYFSGVSFATVIRIFCKEAFIAQDCFSIRLSAKEIIHELILQHQETDWQCFKRLLAEHGWYVAIENSKENYRILIMDCLPPANSEYVVELIPDHASIPHQGVLQRLGTLIRYHHALGIKAFKVARFSDLHPNQNLAASCSSMGQGIGHRYCFGGFFESHQQARQIATVLQQASTCLNEYLEIDLKWPFVAMGSLISIQSDAYPWLADLYQVIAVKLMWKEAAYFSEPTQRLRITLIKKTTTYRNALQEHKSIDLISATVIGVPEEELLKKVGRYRVQLDHYQNKTPAYPAVRMVYPLAGDATGFHFLLTPGSRVRIGFLYHTSNEPVILGAISSEKNIVTRSNQNSYRLRTQAGFEWQIQEEGGHENSLFAPEKSAGFLLKRQGTESGIWFWSRGSQTIEAKGSIQMLSNQTHQQTHHAFQLKAQSDHQMSAQKTITFHAKTAHHQAKEIQITTKEMHWVGETWSLMAKQLRYVNHANSDHIIRGTTHLQGDKGIALMGAERISFKVGMSELSIYAGVFTLRSPKIVLNARSILTGAVSYG